jgi:very-long-chain (3R)-3-hydroxyacyl-CoA dehydratase
MQVSSRLLLIWGIVNAYPSLTTASPFYSSMLFAWSVSEIIRYTYFVLNLRFQQGLGNGVPEWLSWARYNLFFALYPLGIGSEMALVWNVVDAPANRVGAGIKWALIGVLVAYVPGKSISFIWREKAEGNGMLWVLICGR